MKAEPLQSPDRPAMSDEEVERRSRSIIDEFLHINDYKVLKVYQRGRGAVHITTENKTASFWRRSERLHGGKIKDNSKNEFKESLDVEIPLLL